jgi:hypothetical protein
VIERAVSIPKQAFKARRRQLSIANGVLNGMNCDVPMLSLDPSAKGVSYAPVFHGG